MQIVLNYELRNFNYELRNSNYELRIIDYEGWGFNYELRIANDGNADTDYCGGIGCRLSVVGWLRGWFVFLRVNTQRNGWKDVGFGCDLKGISLL